MEEGKRFTRYTSEMDWDRRDSAKPADNSLGGLEQRRIGRDRGFREARGAGGFSIWSEGWKCPKGNEGKLREMVTAYGEALPDKRSDKEFINETLRVVEEVGILEKITSDIGAGATDREEFKTRGHFNSLEYLSKTLDQEMRRLDVDIWLQGQLESAFLSYVLYAAIRVKEGAPRVGRDPIFIYVFDFLERQKKEGRMDGEKDMMQPEEFFVTEGRRSFVDHFGEESITAHLDSFISSGGEVFDSAYKMWQILEAKGYGKKGREIAGTVATLLNDQILWEQDMGEIKNRVLRNLDALGIRGEEIQHYVETVVITLKAEKSTKVNRKLIESAKYVLLLGHEVAEVK